MFPHLLIKPIQSLRKSKKLKEICRQVSLPRSWWRRGCKFNFPPWRSTCLSLPFYSHRGADGESIQDNSEIWRCRGLKNQESHSLMKQSRRLQLLLCPAFPKRIQGKTVTPPSSPRGARKRNQCSSPLTSRKFHWTHIYSLYIYIGSVYMKSEESSDGRCPAQFITTFFRLWICMTLVLFWGWWCSNQLPNPHQCSGAQNSTKNWPGWIQKFLEPRGAAPLGTSMAAATWYLGMEPAAQRAPPTTLSHGLDILGPTVGRSLGKIWKKGNQRSFIRLSSFPNQTYIYQK